MKCPNCGAHIDEADHFCSACGESITEEEKKKQRERQRERKKSQQDETPPIDFSIFGTPPPGAGFGAPPPMGGIPMRWYTFLINFALFAGAILNMVNAFMYFSGLAYVNIKGEIITSEMYKAYPVLQPVDIVYGVLLLGVAVFAVFTRFSLSRLKKEAPTMVLVYFGVSAGVNLVYQLVGNLIAGQFGDRFVLVSFILSFLIEVIFIILNHTYFTKRKHLFTIE